MGHDVVQRGDLGGGTLSLLLSPLPLWPFSLSFFSSSFLSSFLVLLLQKSLQHSPRFGAL